MPPPARRPRGSLGAGPGHDDQAKGAAADENLQILAAIGTLDRMTAVRLLTTADASDDLLAQIRGLLEEAFAGHFSDEDWDNALGGWHAVVTEDDGVVAHAAVVPRTLVVAGRPVPTGYVEAVATMAARRRDGLGSQAMARIGEVVRREFAMGALSTGAHGFYARLGWERWRGPTFVRTASGLVRTEEDDDGVMVLRTGPSAAVDLTAPIACPERPGDDW